MKKTLVLAALIAAATAVPTLPAVAADDTVPEVESKCYVLPLLPNCAAQWNDYAQYKGYHLATPYAWWTCRRAEDGAGHLLDCDSNA